VKIFPLGLSTSPRESLVFFQINSTAIFRPIVTPEAEMSSLHLPLNIMPERSGKYFQNISDVFFELF
jgi:hypothetical protein